MKIFWQMLEATNLLQYFIINWFLQPAIGYWPFLLDILVMHSFPCWNSKHKIFLNKFLGRIFMWKLNFWVPLQEPKRHTPVCPLIHLPPPPPRAPAVPEYIQKEFSLIEVICDRILLDSDAQLSKNTIAETSSTVLICFWGFQSKPTFADEVLSLNRI